VKTSTVLRASAASVIAIGTACLLVTVGLATAFRARQLYSAIVRHAARAVLAFYGITLRVHHADRLRHAQTIYISNHTSTLDIFVLVAMGLPNCRFFLSGFVRKWLPLGVIAWMMGTFFTVPQDRPAERARIFARAERVLRRTGESVYLSPEGGRITTGGLGHFNKGAFHLATNLRVPIVPFYIDIPRHVDPVLGYDAHPGIIDVHVLPAIDTHDWTLDGLLVNVARSRDVLNAFRHSICEPQATQRSLATA
jgi:1-acyl-sn-glycerol-3-phosphate acyltransferase